jgi:hypothetical protein
LYLVRPFIIWMKRGQGWSGMLRKAYRAVVTI